jgi:hypothetical protein
MIEMAKGRTAWHVWLRKMEYASSCMSLATDYWRKGEDRVVGLDIWRSMVNYGLEAEGKKTIPDNDPLTEELAEEKLIPGCGLPGSKEFPQGTFSDALHLDALVELPH